MSAPPLPPLPPKPQANDRYPGPPPPIPPLPQDLRLQTERYNTPSVYELESPPHFENPLIAPRPHKLDRSIPANMARTLDDQVYQTQSPINYAPTSAPLPRQPWSQQQYFAPPPSEQEFIQSLANLSMTSVPQPPLQIQQPPPQQISSPPAQPAAPAAAVPSLTAPLPILSQLQEAAQHIVSPTHDPALKIAWCRDVFVLVDRASGAISSTDPLVGPIVLADPALDRLAHTAIPIVLQLANSHNPAQGKMPLHVAEAIYMRASFAASGAFPDLIRHNPRTAFRDFEAAARGGYNQAWFRLGRDYENFNDHAHAKECFERGAKLNVESCLYRLGMAHLLGQLSFPSNPQIALPFLQRAAVLASLSTPQPAYVYALLLLTEFTQVTVPPSLLVPLIPPGSSPTLEARKHLERAAYLHFGAAQYKLGHAYEFAEPPFPFDALLSVQYYSLASQQGEVEADMALSKWFLCGSGGAAAAAGGAGGAGAGGFEKDEGLALTFAEKAARKGLPSAEFAMGYYAEVGVGQPKDLNKAMDWYQRAKSHGNTDAIARLQALSQPAPQELSRQEHDSITEHKLVRRRTQAAQRAESQPLSPPWEGRSFPTRKEVDEMEARKQATMPPGQGAPARRRPDGRMVVDVIRKNSLAGLPIGAAPPSVSAALGGGRTQLPSVREQSPQSGQSGSGPQTGSPQRMGSPGRRTESPGRVVGGRAPSPGRRLQSSGGENTGLAPGGRADSSGVGMTSLTRLERMRLNLDDLAASPSSPPSAPYGQGNALSAHKSNNSLSASGSYNGSGYSLMDPPVSSLPTAAPMATPRPLQTPATSSTATMGASGGGKKPQTFAEMGIHGAKAEDKDCVIM